MERIDKIIASQGSFSRTDVKKLIKDGRIKLNGSPAADPAKKINITRDKIELDGKPMTLSKHIYIMLNKPTDVVSSTERADHTTVIDLVPDELYRENLFPAGRLDKNTTGFVILTDDGAFAHKILSPKSHISKTYEAVISAPLTGDEIREIENGLDTGGTSFLPAKIKTLEPRDGENRYEIILHEGKYHQIKRMFAHFGKNVLSLNRTKMGGLCLDKALRPGECRLIVQEELALIQK